jgi:hypothetical protein
MDLNHFCGSLVVHRCIIDAPFPTDHFNPTLANVNPVSCALNMQLWRDPRSMMKKGGGKGFIQMYLVGGLHTTVDFVIR